MKRELKGLFICADVRSREKIPGLAEANIDGLKMFTCGNAEEAGSIIASHPDIRVVILDGYEENASKLITKMRVALRDCTQFIGMSEKTDRIQNAEELKKMAGDGWEINGCDLDNLFRLVAIWA